VTTATPAEAAGFTLRPATPDDVPAILECIRRLAEYERLAHECVATEAQLHATLFGATPSAEVVLAFAGEDLVQGGGNLVHGCRTAGTAKL
jgi:hypothetical protein